jgi:hypothetical protein
VVVGLGNYVIVRSVERAVVAALVAGLVLALVSLANAQRAR